MICCRYGVWMMMMMMMMVGRIVRSGRGDDEGCGVGE